MFSMNLSKKSLENIHIAKETTVTVERNLFALILPYIGSVSLKTRLS